MKAKRTGPEQDAFREFLASLRSYVQDANTVRTDIRDTMLSGSLVYHASLIIDLYAPFDLAALMSGCVGVRLSLVERHELTSLPAHAQSRKLRELNRIGSPPLVAKPGHAVSTLLSQLMATDQGRRYYGELLSILARACTDGDVLRLNVLYVVEQPRIKRTTGAALDAPSASEDEDADDAAEPGSLFDRQDRDTE